MLLASAELLRTAVERQKAGDLGEAERLCREVLKAEPDNIDALHRLGHVAHRGGWRDDAIRILESVVSRCPENVAALVDLAHALSDAERFDEAVAMHRRVVEIAPDVAAVHYNLAGALHQSDQLVAAADCYRQALQLDSNFADAHLNLGIVLRELGCAVMALDEFQTVLQSRPDDSQAHLQRALSWLQAGNFEQGWDEYEWRWRAELKPRRFRRPAWDGASLDRRTLLVYGEQGLGDEIQFASCVPEIARQAARCVVECDPRLVPLFARSFPLCEVVARQPHTELDDDVELRHVHYDVQTPIASLPRFLRRRSEDFPRLRRYLKPDAKLVTKWQKRMAELGHGLKVGIAWLGGHRADFRRRRSTTIEMWEPVLKAPGVQFVSLQSSDRKQETAGQFEHRGVVVHDWRDSNSQQDIDDLAARISSLDLVITVDNSTAHLAGAMGVPVWTLLPAAADWRWMTERDDSIWYAGMTLFRQRRLGDWTDVFANVANRLQAMSIATAPAA